MSENAFSPMDYYHQDNGIHEFIFHESSNRALDAWFVHVERLWGKGDPNSTVLFLIDTIDSGTQPLAYALARGRAIVRENPQRPLLRMAFIERNASMMKLIESFVRLVDRRVRVRFFPMERRSEAVKWLLTE